jgi:hypothetical protein
VLTDRSAVGVAVILCVGGLVMGSPYSSQVLYFFRGLCLGTEFSWCPLVLNLGMQLVAAALLVSADRCWAGLLSSWLPRQCILIRRFALVWVSPC